MFIISDKLLRLNYNEEIVTGCEGTILFLTFSLHYSANLFWAALWFVIFSVTHNKSVVMQNHLW